MRKFYWVVFIVTIISLNADAQTFSLVKDINPGPSPGYPLNLTNLNGTLIFQASDPIYGTELWKSDGTPAGTVLIKDIQSGTAGSAPNLPTNANGVIFFTADDGIHGRELWKTDGTEGGTVLVKDINPGSTGSYVNVLKDLNGVLFFRADDGIHGLELWKSDGTEAGTVMVKDIFPGMGNGYPGPLTEFNGTLFFSAADGVHSDYNLWKTDGTEAGTVLIKDFSPEPFVGDIKNVNGVLFLSVGNSPQAELWKSDGTEAGTVFLKSMYPSWLVNVNGMLFFRGSGSGAGFELWQSDGTVAGTKMVKDLLTGPQSSDPSDLTNVNGVLCFYARTEGIAHKSWRSDGTDAGTVKMENIPVESYAKVNDKFYFPGYDEVLGRGIWTSNGGETGTPLQIFPDAGNQGPGYFFTIGSKVFVSVYDNAHGRELWVADIPSQIALPLSLLDFKAQLSANDGLLNWKTSSEQNTSHFEIERSTDGRDFTKAGTVNAAGNSFATKQYNYTDRNITSLGSPVIYYRLKMKDIDSKFTYSKIIAINISSKETVVMLYPNPVRESATLMIAAVKKENIVYSIIDQSGRTMQQRNIAVNEGSNMISVETNSLPAGAYTIILTSNYIISRLKFVKQ